MLKNVTILIFIKTIGYFICIFITEQENLKDDRLFKDFVRYVKAKADVKKYSSGQAVNTVDGIGMYTFIFYFTSKNFVGF